MAWYHRLINIVRAEKLSRDLDREMAFHVDERADELMAQGMGETEARAEARRRFGHPQFQKEATRDADVMVWLESFLADVRYALRALRLSPGFTLVAVLSIALGVGANTAIFSLINAVMIRSLPVPNAGELVAVGRLDSGETSLEDIAGNSLTNPLWEAIQGNVDALDAFAFSNASFNLAAGGEARRTQGSWVSGSYFPVLGARPLAGRLLTRADDQRGCPGTAVVSAGFAAREFGSPESAVGRTVSLDGHPFDIVGVTEPEFFGVNVGRSIQIYTPICSHSVIAGSDRALDQRDRWWLWIMARPRGTLTLAQVNARLAGAAPDINTMTLPPDWRVEDQRRYLTATLAAAPAATGYSPLRTRYADALMALMVVVGVVLLIACANVANLLLARAEARQREMAVRLAIGAGRWRLVRQLLTESVLLSLLGAALGVLFARWAAGIMVQLLATRSSRVWLDLTVDGRVLAFTIAVATVTGILFGLAPAWRAARTAPQAAMQGQGRGAGRSRFAITRGLVVGQVALSLVLLVAAGLLLRSFQKLLSIDPGFRADNVLLVATDIATGGYTDEQRIPLYRDILERMRALPGVRGASASLLTPISGAGWNGDILADGFVPRGERDGVVWFNGVSDGYFATMETRLVAGRDFGPQDAATAAPVAIINVSLARRVFAGQNPIGKVFRTRDDNSIGPPIEVIGVVQDARYRSLRDTNIVTAYMPLAQAELWGSQMNFELRTSGDAAALTPQVRELVGSVNSAITLDFVTLKSQITFSLALPRLLATLSGFFGLLALLLATVGLYGTVSYSVARRHNEIGIRIALGAERWRVVRMVLGEVSRLLTAGAVLGVLIAIAATRLLTTFLYELKATDPTTLVLAVTALAAVALAAGAIPAWRAAKLDAMEALRVE